MKFWDAFNTSVIPYRDRTDLPTVGSSAMFISHKLTVTGSRPENTTNTGSCGHESATSDYQFHNRLVASVAVKWPLIDCRR